MPFPRSLLALALLASCNLPDVSKIKEVTGITPQTSETPETTDTGEKAPLAVRVRAVGPNGVIPRSIVLRATESMFDPQEIDTPLPETNLARISPEVPGTWRITAVDEVAFEPDAPFAPDTTYTVTVLALGSGERLQKPAKEPWTGSFVTPAFAFQRIALRERNPTAARVAVELVFTGPVDAEDVAGKVAFQLNGNPVRPASHGPGRDANTVQFGFAGRSFIQDVPLTVSVAPGVHMQSTEIVAVAGTGQLDLAAAPPMQILSVQVKEGSNGFYVDVVCNDEAGGEDRYYWDTETWDSWTVSDRCIVSSDEAARAIRFDPGVEASVAPGPGGFRLFGEFERGEYTMSIDGGLRTEDGGMLPEAYEAVFTVPERTPSVSFTAKGRYLPRDSWDELPIRTINVDAVELTVRVVPEENLVFWMSGDEPATERTSNVVLKRRLPVREVADEEVTTWVDLDGLLPKAGRGVYELKIRGIDTAKEAEEAAEEEADTGQVEDHVDTGWASWHDDDTPKEEGPTDFSRLLVTDLQIVAKLAAAGPDQHYAPKAHVWVLDTHDGSPVGGAQVRVVRPSGQSLGTCRTDAQGACAADLAADPNDETAPMAVIVTKDDDLTYLKFNDLEVAPPADTTGLPYLDEQPYRAAVWTERGVYRPGETAHLAAIVRGTTHTAPPTSLPVVAKLVDPRGKEIRKKVLTTNAAGLLSVDWTFGDYATTGKWKTVLEAGDVDIGEATFAVEEFVPERMKVEAGIDGAFLADDEVPVAVSARWLFGGNAAGSDVELSCQLVPGAFTPKQNSNYTFGLAAIDDGNDRRTTTIGTVHEKLDDDGRRTINCPPAARSGGFMGAATLVAQAAVFEGDSGRTTLGEARTPLHPEKYYVGLATGSGKVGPGDDLVVTGILVDWDGAVKPAAESVQVTLQRLQEEYLYTWDRAEQRYHYRRVLRRSQEDAAEAAVSAGRFSVTLHPQQISSSYLVVATSGNARTEMVVEGEGYRWWWWGEETSVDATPRPNKPGELVVSAPKTADVGEKIAVKATVPYAGHLLWTVETHDVVKYEWAAVQAGEVEWSFKADEFVPNLYVGALLVKDPHLESAEAYMPDRAYGVTSVALRPAQYVQTIKIDAPREVRPYGPLEVGLDLGPQDDVTYVTVAAVDEGILSLTDYESPDPFDAIFAQRALGVETFETVGWTVLVPPGGPGRSTGGDGDLAGGGRVQMVKPVALWSGVVEVPRDGKTKVTFDVPGYRGELRVMAVSVSAKKMGHADQSVTVKDPIVLQTTLPRFLVAGDEAVLPVFVSNVSGAARDIVVDLSVEDLQDADEKVSTAVGGDRPSPVVVVGDRQVRLHLDQGMSDTVLFKVKAQRAPDAAKFRVVATADALKSLEEIELPVMRPEPEVRDTTRVALVAGSNDLTGAMSQWVDGSDRTRVWVTANPYAPALSHVRELVRYPYGCIEQTTSSTRPLLYVSTLLDAIDPALAKDEPVDKMVRYGLERILSMQTSQGGFAYWPGGGYPTEWGTAYATHLLLDAKEAGYAVPDRALSDALDWLGRQVDKKGGTSADDYTTAYEHYVLALGGRARVAQAQTLLENMAGRTNNWSGYHELHEPKYLLMAAMYLGGDRRYEGELKKPDTSDLTNLRHNTWYFWSDLRSRGFELAVYHDLFGSQGAEGEKLATIVANGLATHRSSWYTTQEMSWGLTGLGKWVGADATDVGKVTMLVDGQEVRGEQIDRKGGHEVVWTLTGASDARALTLDVGRSSRQLYAVISVQGVLADAPPSESNGLWVGRDLLRADGSVLTSTHDLGDALYVRVSIRNTTGDTIQNVAVVDRLPAGFEIENPRLGRGSLPDWLDAETVWEVEHMNLRDDRVEVFGALAPGETKFVVYQVRAVTGGSFTHPPVTAEAMYDPTLHARTAPTKVVVRDPWSGS